MFFKKYKVKAKFLFKYKDYSDEEKEKIKENILNKAQTYTIIAIIFIILFIVGTNLITNIYKEGIKNFIIGLIVIFSFPLALIISFIGILKVKKYYYLKDKHTLKSKTLLMINTFICFPVMILEINNWFTKNILSKFKIYKVFKITYNSVDLLINYKSKKDNKQENQIKILDKLKGLSIEEIEEVKITYLKKSTIGFIIAFIFILLNIIIPAILQNYVDNINMYLGLSIALCLLILLVSGIIISYKGALNMIYYKHINGKHTFKSKLLFLLNFIFAIPIFVLTIPKFRKIISILSDTSSIIKKDM